MNSVNILNYLSMVSNKNIFLNISMHLIVLIAIVSIYLLKDLKTKKYIFNGAVLVLFLSVTINAVVYGNPFHTVTFGILAITSAVEMFKGKNNVSAPQMGIKTIIAFIFILFGLWYPEFVNAGIFEHLVVSPVGIVPCPTLITALGMLNLYYPNVNKMQYVTTVILGIVYGFIGTFTFGVYLDIVLFGIVAFSIYNIIGRRNIKKESMLNEI